MYTYRVKVPTFLLSCVFFILIVDLVGAYRLRGKFSQLASLPAVSVATHAAFAEQANSIAEPDKLRALAIQEHQRLAAADTLAGALLSLDETLIHHAITAGWLALGMAVFYFLFDYRRPPPSS